MMSIHNNKRVIKKYLGYFGQSDIRAGLAMMADEATWWVNGRTDLYPDAGVRTKPEMADAWSRLYDLLDGGLVMDVVTMIGDGDRVAAEVRSRAVTKAGKIYENDYHFLFVIRDGKIVCVREYTDLLHAAAVFGWTDMDQGDAYYAGPTAPSSDIE